MEKFLITLGTLSGMSINPFLFIASMLNFGASVWFAMHRDYPMAVVWIAYAVATFVLSFARMGGS